MIAPAILDQHGLDNYEQHPGDRADPMYDDVRLDIDDRGKETGPDRED
jgi:hypothetical protein